MGAWFVAGGAFLAQSGLFLLDATGALAPHPMYRITERGLEQDLIDYYVGHNERMHSIWWDVALRGLLGPVGWLALMWVLALVHLAGTGRPRQEIGRLFIMLGASAAGGPSLAFRVGHALAHDPQELRSAEPIQ